MSRLNPRAEEVRKRVAKARTHLKTALNLARDVPFTQDDRELLSHTVGQVRNAADDLNRFVERDAR
jgi:hypothetical protein